MNIWIILALVNMLLIVGGIIKFGVDLIDGDVRFIIDFIVLVVGFILFLLILSFIKQDYKFLRSAPRPNGGK